MALLIKNLPANAGDIRDTGLIPGLGRSPGVRHGNLLQYSCLKNPMDNGAWQATLHSVAKSQKWLKQLSSSSKGAKPLVLYEHFFFNVFIFNWRIIALQYVVGFWHTLGWISHGYTYVPSLFIWTLKLFLISWLCWIFIAVQAFL